MLWASACRADIIDAFDAVQVVMLVVVRTSALVALHMAYRLNWL